MSPVALTFFMIALPVLGFAALRRGGISAFRAAGEFSLNSGLALAPRLVLAMITASFASKMLSPAAIAQSIGESSGFSGILLASLLGGLIPGGPMTAFPIAVFLVQVGAGVPQIVALLTGWSVFSLQRILVFEIPILGWKFTLLRVASTSIFPLVAGLIAAAVIS